MPETTENYHRIPVSEGHSGHEIRTISISEEKGIKALYCTDCKEVVTYLFDVDQWTMEEAKEWVEEHKEDNYIPDMVKELSETEEMPGIVVERTRKRMRAREKEVIASTVRFKSYGVLDKSFGDNGTMYVRGFFTDDKQDQVGDVITRQATERAIERWRKWGNIRTMHSYPSGRVEKIGVGDGLAWNEVVTVPVESKTRELIEGGVLKAYSVGIIPRKYEPNLSAMQDSEANFFFPLIIHDYDMVEISYVDHPANYSATITDITSGKGKEFGNSSIIYKDSKIFGKGGDEMEANIENETEVLLAETEDKNIIEDNMDNIPGDAADNELDKNSEEVISDPDEITSPIEEIMLAVRELENRVLSLEGMVNKLIEKEVDEGRTIDDTEMAEVIETLENNNVEDIQKDVEVTEEQLVFGDIVASTDNTAAPNIGDIIVELKDELVAAVLSALSEHVGRTAKVSVNESDLDVDEVINETDVSNMYLEMNENERRQKMRDVLKRAYPAKN